MKRLISILLITILVLSLCACGNTTHTEETKPNETSTTQQEPPEVTTEPEEVIVKMEPQYNMESFSTDALYEAFQEYDEQSKIIGTDLYKAVNGRIVDAKAVKEDIYFLTNDSIYVLDRALFWSKTLNIDVDNNTNIITACRDTITLGDNNENLTIYNNLLGESGGNGVTYEKCVIDELKLNDNDIFVGNQSSMIWDDVYIITDVQKSGITAKIFTHTTPYEANNTFAYSETGTYPFSKEFSTEIEEILFSQDLETANGFVLLKNGELHYFDAEIGSVNKTRQMSIYGDPIQNVIRVWNSRYPNCTIVEKNDGKLYSVRVINGDEWSYTESEIVLPEELTTDMVAQFTHFDSYRDRMYFVLNNGDIYTNIADGNTMIKHELLSEYNKNNNLIALIDIAGYVVAIMDDGYMYQVDIA